MKIVFDADPLCADKHTGIGNFQEGICKVLMDEHKEDDYVLTYFSLKDRKGKEERMKKYRKDNVEIKECPYMSAGMYKIMYGFLPVPYKMFFGQGDVTHFYNFLIPPGVKGKKVCTIHDCAFVRYPETVNFKTRKMLELNIKRTIKRADMIFVDSVFTGNELKDIYKVDDSKITVVYAGIDTEKYKHVPKCEESEKILQKYGIKDKEYFLYLGTIEPRKNLEKMILGYSHAAKKLENAQKDVPCLVLAGKMGWYYDKILETIKKENIEDKVKLIGYIENSEKATLYSRAKAFLFPSLYEGFGMPVLESMACETPVLASTAASLPEVAGDAAIFCDPDSEYSIASGIYRLATEEELAKELSVKGLARSKMFKWEDSARKTYEVYRKLTENN